MSTSENPVEDEQGSIEEFNFLHLWAIWDELDNRERTAIYGISLFHYKSTGLSREFLGTVGIQEKTIDSLVVKGLLEAKPEYIFAQEFLNNNKERFAQIPEHYTMENFHLISSDDIMFTSEYNRCKQIVENKESEIRIRFVNKITANILAEVLKNQFSRPPDSSNTL